MPPDTLLQAVNLCHNHDPWTDAGFVKLVHDPAGRQTLPPRPTAQTGSSAADDACVIGFVSRKVLPALLRAGIAARSPAASAEQGPGPAFLLAPSAPGEEALFLHPASLSYEQRTEQMAGVSAALRTSPDFPFVASGWRSELYTIYGPTPGRKLFAMERSVCAIFGVATFGVHATAYTVHTDGGLRFWVPRRSASKQTWPSMLDNTVAGGLSAGERPLDAILRECEEEAGLPEGLVRPRITPAGALSYFYLSGEGAGGSGLAQPEVQYMYDLLLPADVRPHPVDGEAEEFTLLTQEEVLDAIRTRQFKPNCALVLIDFFLRHGLLAPETEKDYALLLPRLHADLGMATP